MRKNPEIITGVAVKTGRVECPGEFTENEQRPDSGNPVLIAIHKNTVVPYSAGEIYALVNDIEAYPDFLPWCRAALVHEKTDTRLLATVALEAGKIRQSFTTENTMQPERAIDMRLVEGPFKFLSGHWRFDPRSEQSCAIILDIEFEFKNKLLKLALSSTFNRIMDSLVESFTRRAGEIYGKR
jgi:ribosome-associated toxin RatA of RatAB toxin-antitoxin module